MVLSYVRLRQWHTLISPCPALSPACSSTPQISGRRASRQTEVISGTYSSSLDDSHIVALRHAFKSILHSYIQFPKSLVLFCTVPDSILTSFQVWQVCWAVHIPPVPSPRWSNRPPGLTLCHPIFSGRSRVNEIWRREPERKVTTSTASVPCVL